MLQILIFQFLLAIAIILVINFLGKNSKIGFGYVNFSDISESESKNYNIFLRILTPNIVIALTSIILYLTGLDYLVENIFLVVPLYFVVFSITLILTRRILLISPTMLFVVGSMSSFLGWLLYTYSLSKGLTFILPDAANFRSEMWIILILFVYAVINNFQFNSDRSLGRKNNYIKERYLYFKERFYSQLQPNFRTHADLKSAFFSIMIAEDFNRNIFFRFIERGIHRFGFIKTTGIMQVASQELLTDEESIKRAQKIIFDAYQISGSDENTLINKIAESYNNDYVYVNLVLEISREIDSIEKKFRSTKLREHSQALEKAEADATYVFHKEAKNVLRIQVEDSSLVETIKSQIKELPEDIGIEIYDKQKARELVGKVKEQFKDFFEENGHLAMGGPSFDYIMSFVQYLMAIKVASWIFDRILEDVNDLVWKKVKTSFANVYKGLKSDKKDNYVPFSFEKTKNGSPIFLFNTGLKDDEVVLMLEKMDLVLIQIKEIQNPSELSLVCVFNKEEKKWVLKDPSEFRKLDKEMPNSISESDRVEDKLSNLPDSCVSDRPRLPVFNQRDIPGCVAHGATSMLQMEWYNKTGKIIPFSPRFLDILSWEDGMGINDGRDMRVVMDLIIKVGCCTEALLPNDTTLPIEQYRDRSLITKEMMDEAALYKLLDKLYVQI